MLKTSSPAVSVVLSVHNGATDLPGAIETILNQTFTDLELIVINNGSTDGTAAALQKIGDARMRVVHQENAGLAAALNRGISMARGRYIARQDHDDWAKPTRIEKQVAFLEQNPDFALLGTGAEIWAGDRATDRTHDHPTENAALQFELLFDSYFVHSSVMLRKSVLDVVGPYNTDHERQPPEDYDLWSRIARRYKVANLPERLTIYREVPGSMSRAQSPRFQHNIATISAENIAAAVGATAPGPDHWNIAALFHSVPTELSATPDIERMCRTITEAGRRIDELDPGSDVAERAMSRARNLRYIFDRRGDLASPPYIALARRLKRKIARSISGD